MGRRLRALGFVAVAVGLVVLVAAPSLDFGDDSLASAAAALLGVVAVTLGAGQLLERRLAEPERWRPPTTERGRRVPTPDDGFADLSGRERTERLRRLAVRSLVDATGCTPADAADRLDGGTWTDDSVARQYFTPGAVDLRGRTRLRLALRREPVEAFVLERTVRAIRALREGSDR
ncbi:DUF7269 family protein [Halosimplex halophilum]|uniref:DUF7269 family protein n=1 Tax=Halosimplex halophilum TaxID=2559572 RepID=UPI00107FA861|nr:hypothetical protein [Halosimplex halophilum]